MKNSWIFSHQSQSVNKRSAPQRYATIFEKGIYMKNLSSVCLKTFLKENFVKWSTKTLLKKFKLLLLVKKRFDGKIYGHPKNTDWIKFYHLIESVAQPSFFFYGVSKKTTAGLKFQSFI